MDNTQIIKRAILPYIKGLPIILIILIGTVIVTSKLVNYITPKYESTSKIKVENEAEGVSSLNLYKDFNIFTLASKIKTEVEIIKSKELLSRVAQKLNNPIDYHRVGEMQVTELYGNSPFVISDYNLDKKTYDREICINIIDSSRYILTYGEKTLQGHFGDSINFMNSKFVIDLNNDILSSKGSEALIGHFTYKVRSIKSLTNMLKENIDVANKDEEIPIIRISYKDEIPERAAYIVNTLVDVYVNDYISTKSEAARKTVTFIDARISEVSLELQRSEIELEEFKRQYNVVNTKQETETGLREISQLQLNMISLQIENEAMDSVLSSLNRNSSDTAAIPMNFEAFADLVFTEVANDINTLLSKRRELIQVYQPSNDRIKLVDKKLKDLKIYLIDGINKSKKSKESKIKSLQRQIDIKEKQFILLPEREKKLIILEREFMLNQKIYNFLSEKRVESSIAQAARISFHRVIEKAVVPTEPVSPNKKFLVIISGFLAFLTGLALIYIKTQFAGSTSSRVDIEHASTIPVIGIVREFKKDSPMVTNNFISLVNELLAKDKIKKKQLVIIGSASRHEGKSFVSENLARAFDKLEWKTMLVDYNLQNSSLSKKLGLNHSDGLLQLKKDDDMTDITYQPFENPDFSFIPTGIKSHNIDEMLLPLFINDKILKLTEENDIVIVDTPGSTITNQSLLLTKMSNCIIHVIRGNKTPSFLLSQADILKDNYGLENLNLLYNSAPRATNYDGMYSGSRFAYGMGKGLINRLKHYIKVYIKD